MYLKHLSLTNFRKFARLDIDLPKRVVLLTGDNAQGKTTVLEAIYFLAAFTSFQTHADRQIVNLDEAKSNSLTVARIVAEYQRAKSKHRLEVRLILEPVGVLNGQRLRKEILLDGVKKSANEIIGHFNSVIFVPQMSQIIEGAPEERRRYLNLALAQSVPAYARVLSEYNQALTQRNALLKMLGERGGNSDQLEVWDDALSRLGSQIILWRIEAIQRIEHLASRVHHELTHGHEILRLAYEPAYDPVPKPNGQLGLKIDTAVDRLGFELNDIQNGFRERLREIPRPARHIQNVFPRGSIHHRDSPSPPICVPPPAENSIDQRIPRSDCVKHPPHAPCLVRRLMRSIKKLSIPKSLFHNPIIVAVADIQNRSPEPTQTMRPGRWRNSRRTNGTRSWRSTCRRRST